MDDETDYDDQSETDENDGSDAPINPVHQNLIGDALSQLESQGFDTHALADMAGVGSVDPSQMSQSDLISMAQTLGQEHPEVMQNIAQRFPEAQGLFESAEADSDGGQDSTGGGFLGRLFGG